MVNCAPSLLLLPTSLLLYLNDKYLMYHVHIYITPPTSDMTCMSILLLVTGGHLQEDSLYNRVTSHSLSVTMHILLMLLQ